MRSLSVIFAVAIVLSSCNSDDNGPTPLIVGSWRPVAFKSPDGVWQNRDSSLAPLAPVAFFKDGNVSNIGGGWCNVAERYKLKNDTLDFTYSPPQCIPFVNPGPGNAKVLKLDGNTLELKWLRFQTSSVRYERIR